MSYTVASDQANVLTNAQFLDLFCYVMRAAETQLQPDVFSMPHGTLCLVIEGQGETPTIFYRDGWPLAIEVPECGYFSVLSGIAKPAL
ncbi:hypothetical protein RJE46_24505 (plasmid) [Cedecea neteri]|uniref:hypothetical protein n=1 Tax=Cedecea neteri TaxID=158822 RepID=UPI002892B623|nr:hypothetical protein [Cedecea neteri]WNJ82242.1 hypothetical protein RJE46_24505 [Cedecea neteri]